MDIYATCTCGKRLKIRDDLVGQHIKCPACDHPLFIAAPKNATKRDAPSVKSGGQGQRTCSACALPMPETLVICPHCGTQSADASASTNRMVKSASRNGPRLAKPLQFAAICVALATLVVAGLLYFGGQGSDGQSGVNSTPPSSHLLHTAQEPPASKPKGYFGALAQARRLARGTSTGSTMRQIGYAMTLYVEQHDGWFPDNLQQLQPYMPELEHLLARHTGMFIYVKPMERLSQISDRATTPLLYESLNGEPNSNGPILYADGRIEMGQ